MKKTISFKGTPVTIEDKLNLGEVFPNFRAVTKTLSEFELSDYKGKKVIVNTFPSVDTGVCALQTINFNKAVGDLTDTVVITVSKAPEPLANPQVDPLYNDHYQITGRGEPGATIIVRIDGAGELRTTVNGAR